MSGREIFKGVAKAPCTSLKLKSYKLFLKLMQEHRWGFVAVSVSVVC